MKKILSIIAGILAVASCEFPDANSFSVKNCGDYLNYKDGTLSNDYGTKLTVVEDQTDKNWAVEGSRMYAVFDVLNANYDVTLKSYMLATMKPVSGKFDDPTVEAADPIEIMDCSIAGFCLNVIFNYYYKEGSDVLHKTDLYYNDDKEILTLRLVHEGGGESPVNFDADALKTTSAVICFPLTNLIPEGELRTVVIEYDYLTKDLNDQNISVHTSKALYNQQVLF